MSARKPTSKVSLAPMRRWKPPRAGCITAVDAHTGVAVPRHHGRFPELPGDTIWRDGAG
jgi:hypothetical protein